MTKRALSLAISALTFAGLCACEPQIITVDGGFYDAGPRVNPALDGGRLTADAGTVDVLSRVNIQLTQLQEGARLQTRSVTMTLLIGDEQHTQTFSPQSDWIFADIDLPDQDEPVALTVHLSAGPENPVTGYLGPVWVSPRDGETITLRGVAGTPSIPTNISDSIPNARRFMGACAGEDGAFLIGGEDLSGALAQGTFAATFSDVTAGPGLPTARRSPRCVTSGEGGAYLTGGFRPADGGMGSELVRTFEYAPAGGGFTSLSSFGPDLLPAVARYENHVWHYTADSLELLDATSRAVRGRTGASETGARLVTPLSETTALLQLLEESSLSLRAAQVATWDGTSLSLRTLSKAYQGMGRVASWTMAIRENQVHVLGPDGEEISTWGLPFADFTGGQDALFEILPFGSSLVLYDVLQENAPRVLDHEGNITLLDVGGRTEGTTVFSMGYGVVGVVGGGQPGFDVVVAP